MSQPKILFLRTFKNDLLNFVVLNSLALAVRGEAIVEIVGDLRDRHPMETTWREAFGSDMPMTDVVDLIPSTRDAWRGDVLRRIDDVDAIVLHISPKDIDFPDFPFAPPNTQLEEYLWDRVMDSPHALPITGRGLLREICYLNRLRRLPDTVVICDAKYQPTLDDLIALGGMMGDATDMYGNFVTPRLTAIDKQVGHLRKAFRGLTYQHPGTDNAVLPRLAGVLNTALLEIIARSRSRERTSFDLDNVLGTSASPRPLPPDDELKILTYTNVEEVLFLPSGQLVEISHEEMAQILSREAVRTGCPYCRARLSDMFFFTRGLQRHLTGDGEKKDWPNAVCQVCGHKSSLFGDDMLAPQ